MRQEKSRFIASVAVSLIVAALVVAPGAWAASTFKILHVFRRSSGGQGPRGTLVSDAAGNLYGTTVYGGSSSCPPCGVVFKLAPNPDGTWTEHVLHRFTGGTDGEGPFAGVILDAAGNLYGTTDYLGSSSCACGVVFKLAPNPDGTWTEHVLHRFLAGTDGSNRSNGDPTPSAGVILDAAGNLYGTTYFGGSGGWGTVFKLMPNPDGTWTEHLLHRFTGGTDGADPSAGVISDATGNLYGTTQYGGSGGLGTVFELMPNPDGTWTEQVLYSFTGGTDGTICAACAVAANPVAGVILDAAGNLYGTAQFGGAPSSCVCGAVFKLAPNPDGTWTEHVLHRFTDADGAYPSAGVILDAVGNLYGTTEGGGVGYGVVFELSRRASGGWSERVLHTFLGYGAGPEAGLLRGASGNLYGTASGGTSGGLVFEIKP